MCLTANGELFTWGSNVCGQLGRTQGDGWGYPQLVPALMGMRMSQVKLRVTRHTSHVTRHTSHVTRCASHVARHTSHVIRLVVAAPSPSPYQSTASHTHGAGNSQPHPKPQTKTAAQHAARAPHAASRSNSHGQLGSMSPSRQAFVAQPRAVPKLIDFPVEIVSCGPATVVAMCARGHSDADVQSPLQCQAGGGSPRTPIQSAGTPMWLGDLPYWKVGVLILPPTTSLTSRAVIRMARSATSAPKSTTWCVPRWLHLHCCPRAPIVVSQMWADEDAVISGILFSP